MTFILQTGTAPVLVSMPHIGTEIPQELQSSYVPRALGVEDTDWHLAQLYEFLPSMGTGMGMGMGMGASVLQPKISRYVIDLNRPPDDAPMYPGAANTELCPTHFFNGDTLYRDGCAPTAEEIQRRKIAFWQPYHAALEAELARIKAIHGFALLWDAHSIRSRIPWLFEGKLPDLNIGTASGAAAHASISDAAAAQISGFTQVINGRFKGGYITRHYGQPAQHIHAIQLEKCQSLYMQETLPFTYEPSLASKIQPTLQRMMQSSLQALRALHE